MEVPIETWCERVGARIAFTKDVYRSEDGEDGNETESGERMSVLKCGCVETGSAV